MSKQLVVNTKLDTLSSNNPDSGHNDGEDDPCGAGTIYSILPSLPPIGGRDTPTCHDEGPVRTTQ